jgi:hypothetical protein
MSWNNVIPAWLIVADSVINQYHKGELDYDRAKAELEALGVPDTMMKRLDETNEKEQ